MPALHRWDRTSKEPISIKPPKNPTVRNTHRTAELPEPRSTHTHSFFCEFFPGVWTCEEGLGQCDTVARGLFSLWNPLKQAEWWRKMESTCPGKDGGSNVRLALAHSNTTPDPGNQLEGLVGILQAIA